MLKLKNISNLEITLKDLGMQLLFPEETVELENMNKFQAANSNQIIELLTNNIIAVIDNDNTQINNLSTAINMIKGFTTPIVQTYDKKLLVQASPRPLGTFTSFSCEGDNPNNELEVGNGQEISLYHKIGDPLEQHIYIDYNTKENKTFISEGFAIWENCNFDKIILSVVPKVTLYTTGINTNFNIYGGFLIVPANGDGNIQLNYSEINLVEIPFNIDNPSIRQSSAFWDADYNFETHKYENLRPNLTGTGQFNIFSSEIKLETIVKLICLSNSTLNLRTSDVVELGLGMRLKLDCFTKYSDHEWKFAICLTLNRQHST